MNLEQIWFEYLKDKDKAFILLVERHFGKKEVEKFSSNLGKWIMKNSERLIK